MHTVKRRHRLLRLDRERIYAISSATIINVSETVIPHNIKFLHIYCFSGPHLATVQ